MSHGFALVVDIGKTITKVSLWSRDGRMIDRLTRANALVEVDGLRRLDAVGIADFLLAALARLGGPDVEYIIPVAHGAGVAAVCGDALVILPLDYEQDLPPDLLSQYRRRRDPFAVTGSPPLPQGLNTGAQLHSLDEYYPHEMERATLLPWAQYWAWWLSGEARSEVTSLGCHSDLWNPTTGEFSALADSSGWSQRFAPIAFAGEIVGTLRPGIAAQTGLSPRVKVLAGLHDSNAALLAARGFAGIAGREATALSTGTWFVAMRLEQEAFDLASVPEARDCLVNVDPFGRPVLSARFMGGRELELLTEDDSQRVDIAADQPLLLSTIGSVLDMKSMVLPTLMPGTGPFPDRLGGWMNRPADGPAQRTAACLYAALITDTMLDVIGARERLLVEGRFAQATVFVRALATLRPGTLVYTTDAGTDVSFGALRLIDPELVPRGELAPVVPLSEDFGSYRALWRTRVAAGA